MAAISSLFWKGQHWQRDSVKSVGFHPGKFEESEDEVTRLLLQEIDFLALSNLGSSVANRQDHKFPDDGSNELLQSNSCITSGCLIEQISQTSAQTVYSGANTTISSDRNTLDCDELLGEFDLLSYADSSDNCLLPQAETLKDLSTIETALFNELLSSHDLPNSDTQFTKLKEHPQSTIPENSSTNSRSGKAVRLHQEKQSKRDVDEPKRPQNGFIRYSVEHRSELSKKYPSKDNRSISKLLGIKWKKLSAEEKQPYIEEFNNDIHEIRSQNPKWRYAPAKRSAEELIDPMIERLRPREKLRSKISRVHNKDLFFPTDKKSDQSIHHGRQSPLQHSATTWKQCDACGMWRPLPGHIDSADLPKKWYCHLNPDLRFNSCETQSAPAVPSVMLLDHSVEQRIQSSLQSPFLLVLPAYHTKSPSFSISLPLYVVCKTSV